MTVQRGEIWIADLNPIRGSEQAGRRPVLIVQNDSINTHARTTVAIPFTTNRRRASLPSCVLVAAGEGGLGHDSVALCNQVRVLDSDRLESRLGALSEPVMEEVENSLLYTLGITY